MLWQSEAGSGEGGSQTGCGRLLISLGFEDHNGSLREGNLSEVKTARMDGIVLELWIVSANVSVVVRRVDVAEAQELPDPLEEGLVCGLRHHIRQGLSIAC